MDVVKVKEYVMQGGYDLLEFAGDLQNLLELTNASTIVIS